MSTGRKPKIILAKFGLDSHDNGIRIVARWLQEAGYEVVFMGLYNTAEGVVKAAIDEDADIIGGSFLGGEHLYYASRLISLARERGLERVKFIVGGVIPPDDVVKLKEMGIHEVFTPGTPREVICERIGKLLSG